MAVITLFVNGAWVYIKRGQKQWWCINNFWNSVGITQQHNTREDNVIYYIYEYNIYIYTTVKVFS